MLDKYVKKVTGATPMLCAHRVHAIKAKFRELMSSTLPINVVSLIRNENDGLTATAQKLRYL